MTLSELTERLGFKVLTSGSDPCREISGGYASDLLSDVLANVREDMVWITLHTHLNIVAVASLRKVAAIIIVSGAVPDEGTLEHAHREGVTILTTPMPAFEAAGRIYELLK